MFVKFVYLVSFLLLSGAILAVIGLRLSTKILETRARAASPKQPARIRIIIPVLNEHQNIETCLSYFEPLLNDLVRLTLVFSERERLLRQEACKEIAQGRRTIAELRGLIATDALLSIEAQFRERTKTGSDLFLQLEQALYTWEMPGFVKRVKECSWVDTLVLPDPTGVMADQLNYALEALRIGASRSAAVIYNIDSQPEAESLDAIVSYLHRAGCAPLALQQCSLYRFNHSGPTGFSGKLLEVGRQWQNRWSLTYEFPKLLIAERMERIGARSELELTVTSLIRPFNYCVGHGLTLTPELLDLLEHHIPSTFWNEDAYLGYHFALHNIPLRSLPWLDVADFTADFTTFVAQQGSWFHGPLLAFCYWRRASVSRLRALVLASKLFWNAVVWAFLPLLWLVVVIGFALKPQQDPSLFLLFAIASLIYGPLVNVFVSSTIRRRVPIVEPGNQTANWLLFYVTFLIHGLAAWWHLLQLISVRLASAMGAEITLHKHKTRRT